MLRGIGLIPGTAINGPIAGGPAEQASNTARGTPGNRRNVANKCLCTHYLLRTQGHGAFGAPAFRAPSNFRGAGMGDRTTGVPGACQTMRAAKLCHFLPSACSLLPSPLWGGVGGGGRAVKHRR